MEQLAKMVHSCFIKVVTNHPQIRTKMVRFLAFLRCIHAREWTQPLKRQAVGNRLSILAHGRRQEFVAKQKANRESTGMTG